MAADAPTADELRKRAPGLLATKLYLPSPRPNGVVRTRLLHLLGGGSAARLILLSAPAGYGKTTLLAAWLHQGNRRAGWLALDAADNDPARFLAYVVAALPVLNAGHAGELADLLRAPEPPPVEAALAALVNEAAQNPEEGWLVLDDYHVITSPAVHNAVAFLLHHLPPNLHLVIGTRADPPLPLARLRSRGQLVELRAADLCFTAEEAAAFLRETMGLALAPGQAAALGERTEGWVAGLQLAALSLAGRADVDAFLHAFTGSHRFILDFLVDEVLRREPEPVQRFLLDTAVLNPFCAALCDAVTGRTDSAQMIDLLERRNLFVVLLDDNRCWYRYHHLFADLLQARLAQAEPRRAAELRSRAATWCEGQGFTAEAIGYALAAQDRACAARLVAACWGPATNAGEIETVWGWLAALPAEVVRKSAPLSVACCWVLWLKGQPELMEPHLFAAEAALNELMAAGGWDEHSAILAPLPVHIAALRSFVARYRADYAAAVAYAERAREVANATLLHQAAAPAQLAAQLHALIALALATACDGAGDLLRAAEAYSEVVSWSRAGRNAAGLAVTYRLAGVLRLLGRLAAAEAACRDALRFLTDQGMARLPAAGVLHVALAEVLLERNEVAAAEEHLAQGSELGQRSGRLDAVRNAAAVLVRLRLGRGDVAGALASVTEAQAALGDPPSPLAQAELLSLRARVLIRQGSLVEAAACIGEAERLAAHERGLTREFVTLAAARLWLAQHEPGAVAAQLAQALADAEACGWSGAALELRILHSLACARQGDNHKAEAGLQAALALAEARGYVRLFLDEGPPLADLLQALAARQSRTGSGGRPSPFFAALLAAFDAPGSRPAVPAATPSGATALLVEPLSEREIEVLRLLAEGLTNEQIARRLVIALGTVKAHIHNIAGKLGAQNRAHAVARAQELGLL